MFWWSCLRNVTWACRYANVCINHSFCILSSAVASLHCYFYCMYLIFCCCLMTFLVIKATKILKKNKNATCCVKFRVTSIRRLFWLHVFFIFGLPCSDSSYRIYNLQTWKLESAVNLLLSSLGNVEYFLFYWKFGQTFFGFCQFFLVPWQSLQEYNIEIRIFMC